MGNASRSFAASFRFSVGSDQGIADAVTMRLNSALWTPPNDVKMPPNFAH